MILPPATLGMLGGGQLGRYFVMAAHRLGYKVVVLDPDLTSIAGAAADHHIVAAYDDPTALHDLASRCAAVTCEFENVPATALALLEQYQPVRPAASAVRICQDRREEKAFLSRAGIPVARTRPCSRASRCRRCPPPSSPPSSRPPARGTTAKASGPFRPPISCRQRWPPAAYPACWNSGWRWRVSFP